MTISSCSLWAGPVDTIWLSIDPWSQDRGHLWIATIAGVNAHAREWRSAPRRSPRTFHTSIVERQTLHQLARWIGVNMQICCNNSRDQYKWFRMSSSPITKAVMRKISTIDVQARCHSSICVGVVTKFCRYFIPWVCVVCFCILKSIRPKLLICAWFCSVIQKFVQLHARCFKIYIHREHYNDVIMGAIASQITSLTIVYPIVYSDADQRKRQSSASLAFVRGIHRGPVNSPHKWPVTRKMFPFDDVIIKVLNERVC